VLSFLQGIVFLGIEKELKHQAAVKYCRSRPIVKHFIQSLCQNILHGGSEKNLLFLTSNVIRDQKLYGLLRSMVERYQDQS